jgi:hypothetical protein
MGQPSKRPQVLGDQRAPGRLTVIGGVAACRSSRYALRGSTTVPFREELGAHPHPHPNPRLG